MSHFHSFHGRLVATVGICLSLTSLYAQESAISAISSLDWNSRAVKTVLSLDTQKSGIKLPTGRNAALQKLEMEAPSLLKDPYFSIVIDSSQRLGDAMINGHITLAELNVVLDQGSKTPPVFSFDLNTISMNHTVSLSRISSLFIRHTVAWQGKHPLETVATREFTGIIIDARGTLPIHGEYGTEKLTPCLFPRLWSADMDVAYEKSMVDPEIARQESIVAYSSSLNEADYRERVGADPLRITAREVFGTNRTDPVISMNDYLKIVSNTHNRQLLKQGKVVIICDPDKILINNLGPVKNDDYYFTYRDIARTLEKKTVRHIDFSDTWEGLKLTIYDIRFIADTAMILPEERSRLDGIAEALKNVPDRARFSVQGHTASIGKPAGELQLSDLRAKTIAEELAKRGIDPLRIESIGFGGTRPVATNETDEGRAKNRRVEITIKLD